MLPLEKNTIREREQKRKRQIRRRLLREAFEALKYRKWRKLYRSMKALLHNEYAAHKKISANLPKPAPDFERLYFSDKRIAVYTAIFGDYDCLREPLFCPDNVDYFVFTDREVPGDSKWKKMPYENFMNGSHMTGTEKNRFLKMFPHLLFGEYEYSVYIDGSILVTTDFTALAARTEEFPVAMHLHKNRDCVYEEIEACLKKRKDTPQALLKQDSVLRNLGVAPHWGLLEAPVIARRHHDPLCKKMMDTWWECFLSGSCRDQIALIHCLWILKISPQKLGGLGENALKSSQFIWESHRHSKES